MNKFPWQKIPTGILSLALVFLLHTAISPAQERPRLDLKTTLEKEVMVEKEGKWVVEKLPVENTNPGDVLVFNISYLNKGMTGAADARIVNPVPEGTVLIPESITGDDADINCSIDNALSWHKPPVMIRIKNSDGREVIRPAPADRYTHIKWVIKKPVLPGRSGRVSFKVTVK